MGAFAGPTNSWFNLSATNSLNGLVIDGLVLALDAGRSLSYSGSGTIWTDLSGQGNNGTISGPTYDSANGGSLMFDGINNDVNIGQPAVSLSPNKWTICVWLKPKNKYSRFLTPNSAGIDQWLEYDNNNQRVNVRLTELADINNRSVAGSSNTIPIDSWSYSCVSIDTLNIKIYANSILTNEYTETISIANWQNNWLLGQRGGGSNRYWYSGQISNFMVYNRALTAQEIQQNFNALRGRFGI